MKVEKGDLVRLEYSAKADGALFDTTFEEEAKTARIHDPKGRYGPVLVAVGKNQVIPGLDEALQGAEEKKPVDVSIPPEKAFGQRNPDLVRLIPLQRFRQQNVNPLPGMVVELDGRQARVQSVSGGRVRVDFNHDLAGKTLDYSFTVEKMFKTPADKVSALAEDAGFKASFAEGVVSASLESTEKKATELAVKKLRFLQACFSLVDGVKTVKFDEKYTA